jgi:hypothetical protein
MIRQVDFGLVIRAQAAAYAEKEESILREPGSVARYYTGAQSPFRSASFHILPDLLDPEKARIEDIVIQALALSASEAVDGSMERALELGEHRVRLTRFRR